MTTFTHAIVRAPGDSFADGLTEASLGAPDLGLARKQHAAYCDAIVRCGVALTRLDADERFPDSTFVEDTAVLTANLAVLARPGAPSREGEVDSVAGAVRGFFRRVASIVPPGTLDGGDVCQAGDRFFIGLSRRTNLAGAAQLIALLEAEGFTAETIDIRHSPTLLHLKSGIAWIGRDTIVLGPELAAEPALRKFARLVVEPGESYGANCVAINDHVLIPAGHDALERSLSRASFGAIPLDVSEFRKMDGGLSCLSLRFANPPNDGHSARV